jgi:hypothetical protein
LIRPFVVVILVVEVGVVGMLYGVVQGSMVRIPTSSNSYAQVPRIYLLALSLVGMLTLDSCRLHR